MKFKKTFFYGLFAVLLLISFIIFRRDNMLQIFAAFFALIWIVQLPGSLILILAEGKTTNYRRIILLGNVIGLALVPLLYYLLYFFNFNNSFDIALTCLNILLGMILIFRVRNGEIKFSSFGSAKLNHIFFLISVVMIICSIREFSQMLSWNFVFNSKHDTDAGTLMSMVIGLKNYGYLVNMNYAAAPASYHHFIYLLMALVMKISHIGILPLYQVVFPLYTFSFMVFGAYYLMLTFNSSGRVALLSAVSLLLLDDFYLLNQVIKVLIKKQPLFTIESIEWLHNSLSSTISLFILFVIIAELYIAERERFKNYLLIILIISIGTLACYKISTWACLIAGMIAASVFNFRKNKKLVLLTILSAVAGIACNKYLSGMSHGNFSSDGMQQNIAYPILRSEVVKKYLHIQNDFVTLHELSFKAIVVVLILALYYIIGIFGVRLFYVNSIRKKGIRSLSFTPAVIIFSVIGGIAVSFLLTPKIGQHNTLYFILTGMYLLSVVSVPMVYEYFDQSKNLIGKIIIAGIIIVQLGSGALQVLQPFVNPVKASSLSSDWFEAMEYIKKNTEKNSLLAYNRHQLKDNYYKDDFDFVPVYAERPVVVGGKQYFPDYELKKAKNDSLFTVTSPDIVKRISKELTVDYILFDKWKGGNMSCRDSSVLRSVFTNNQVDIYKVENN